MSDTDAIEEVNKVRDQIANIFTRYQSGEVLSKAANQTPAIEGEVAEDQSDLRNLKVATLMNTLIRKAGVPRYLSNAITAEWIRDNVKTDISAFLSALPDDDILVTPPDDASISRDVAANRLNLSLDMLTSKTVEIG